MSKILHGGRIGALRKDVAEFTSSIKDDVKLAKAVVDINKAHVVMLTEQKIIKKADGAKILAALTKHTDIPLDASSEDVHMAVEEVVLQETGAEIGGNLHVAKSRNDQVATAVRMELRRNLLSLMFSVVELQESLLATAEMHLQTVILEYTHLQAAQPVTFAHYLISHFDALERDLQRLQETYARVNLSPMGAGALATTSFPINRERVAELLGFNGIVENSIDAVGSRDFLLETTAALTLIAVNLSRLAEDLIVWSAPDFGVIELPDEFASTSSIMPQKKNPEVLEVIRARASHVLGDFVASAAAIKSLPSTYNLDFQEVTPKLWAAAETVNCALNIFAKLIPNLKVTADVSRKAQTSFAAATELANMLVRKYNVPFRTAHKIVGVLVKQLIEAKQTFSDVTPVLLQKIAQEVASIKLIVKADDIAEATDPLKIVEAYAIVGGPAPTVVKRALTVRMKRLAAAKSSVSQLQQKIVEAESQLQSAVNSFHGNSHETEGLKIQNGR
ncbi:MAG: argininosuccinate lyase [Candidatus Bathyarchaeota archaeon]|nr:argininosuccinate lyase [Candidatus Bathyarchaeota archaeon]